MAVPDIYVQNRDGYCKGWLKYWFQPMNEEIFLQVTNQGQGSHQTKLS